VFSGVSGGNSSETIGDVLAPSTWTLSASDSAGHVTTSQYEADPAMLGVAQAAAAGMTLSQDGHIGDCGCAGIDPSSTPTIHFPLAPMIRIGGTLTGHTSDPFGGNPLPCVPVSDTFGCQPCRHLRASSDDPASLATTTAPFLSPSFFTWYQAWSSGENGTYGVEDMETAAVASVAAAHTTPFIGFRSPSDVANGDPISVGGQPVASVFGPLSFVPQFLAYRQYAADHAAAVALAFLQAW
jgi:hypothetical protein